MDGFDNINKNLSDGGVSDLHALALAAIAPLLGMPITNYRRVIEKNIDMWNEIVFPVLDDHNIPKNVFVCENILNKAGYEITPKQLGVIVSRINKKRKPKGVASESSSGRPLVTTPSVMTSKVDSGLVAPRKVVPGASVAAKIEPVVSLPVPAATGIDDISWHDEAVRLKSEKAEDFKAEISAVDVQMVNYFDEIRRTEFVEVKTMSGYDGTKISDYFMDNNIRACFSDLRRKYDSKNLEFMAY